MPTLQEVVSKQTTAELRTWLKAYNPSILPKSSTSKAGVVEAVLGHPDAIPASIHTKTSSAYKCSIGAALKKVEKKNHDRVVSSLAAKPELFRSPVLSKALKATLRERHGGDEGGLIYRAAKRKIRELEKEGIELPGTAQAPIAIDDEDDTVRTPQPANPKGHNKDKQRPKVWKSAPSTTPAAPRLPAYSSTAPDAVAIPPPPAPPGRPSWRIAAQ